MLCVPRSLIFAILCYSFFTLSRFARADITQVFDDRDPLIHYSSGQWGQAGVSEEYQGTTSYTKISGANASFSFTGELYL